MSESDLIDSDDSRHSHFRYLPTDQVNRSESPFISTVVVCKRHNTAALSSTKNQPSNDPVLRLLSTRLIFSLNSMPPVRISLHLTLFVVPIKLVILTIVSRLLSPFSIAFASAGLYFSLSPLIWYLFISRGYQIWHSSPIHFPSTYPCPPLSSRLSLLLQSRFSRHSHVYQRKSLRNITYNHIIVMNTMVHDLQSWH